MSIIVNLRYTGKSGSARAFAEEMTSSGTVDMIRNENGNLRYEYYLSFDDPETVLLIDEWTDQAAIDRHHASPMMQKITELRDNRPSPRIAHDAEDNRASGQIRSSHDGGAICQ